MPISQDLAALDPEDLRTLQNAKNLLENPGLAAQLTSLVGEPIESLLKKMPKGFNKKLTRTLESALKKSAVWAQKTMGERDNGGTQEPWSKTHLASVAVTGGVAGFIGPWAMLVEVPLTTTIIFRSIADIARSAGEQVKSGSTIEECIKVFALGGPTKSDDGTETGYYAVRAGLANQVQMSVNFLAKQAEAAVEKAASAAAGDAGPALVRLIQKVAELLGITYSEKLAAQMLPIIGGVAGATVNVIFMEHFQSMATGHFTVRRLERKYGEETIKMVYKSLPSFEELPKLPAPQTDEAIAG